MELMSFDGQMLCHCWFLRKYKSKSVYLLCQIKRLESDGEQPGPWSGLGAEEKLIFVACAASLNTYQKWLPEEEEDMVVPDSYNFLKRWKTPYVRGLPILLNHGYLFFLSSSVFNGTFPMSLSFQRGTEQGLCFG